MTGPCCVDVVESHRSVRSFSGEEVPEEHLKLVLRAAQRHVSPWNLQPVSVTVVKDDGVKERLAEALWGQSQIRDAPVFLVFAVDYAKIARALENAGKPMRKPGLAEIVQGVISASVALAWSILVAEELGYVVNIIAAYGKPCEVSEILGYPKYVIPVAGLLVGKPKGEIPPVSPRAPVEAVVAYDAYGDVMQKATAYASTADGFIDKVARVLGPGGPVEAIDEDMRRCYRERGFEL